MSLRSLVTAKWLHVAAAVVAISLSTAITLDMVGAHSKQGPHKRLLGTRWYEQVQAGDYDEYMTLSVSAFAYECLGSTSDCRERWSVPFNRAHSAWSSQPTTADFVVGPDFSSEYDVIIGAVPLIGDDPFLLGLALPLDANLDLCIPLATCVFRHQLVAVADLVHSGSYDSGSSRQSTIAHELGHSLSLAHESVGYSCGRDATGVIPQSIMAYDCIDPVALGGSGIVDPQAWDVCGVNHAYHDPTIGYAGCSSGSAPTNTPTRTPTRTPTSTPDVPFIGISSVTRGVGQEGSLEVRTGAWEPPGLGVWTVDINYDPDVVAPMSCAPQNGGVCNSEFDDDTMRITGASATGLTSNAVLASIIVRCQQVGTSPLDLQLRIVADATIGNPQDVATEAHDGLVTCGNFVFGDASCDGFADPIDSNLILQLGAGMIPALPCPGNGDADGNGVVDIVDATIILQYSAGMISTLPP